MARKNKTRRKPAFRPETRKTYTPHGQPTRHDTPAQRVLIGVPSIVKRRMTQLGSPQPVNRYRDVSSSLRASAPLSASPARTVGPVQALIPSGGLAQAMPAGASKKLAAARKITTEKHRVQSNLSLAKTPEPDQNQSSPKARERSMCKKRPDSKKAARSPGGGGGKKFIPWCG